MSDRLRSGRVCILLGLLLVAIGLLLGVPPGNSVQAQEERSTTVIGQVINGTPGGEIPVGAPAELVVLDNGDVTDVFTGTIAADATISFDGLDLEVGRTLVIRLPYRGVTYLSDPLILSEEGSTNSEIRIYETTNDDARIYVEQAHLFLVPGGEVMHIAEVYAISNNGDRTYVGEQTTTGDQATLSFSLPADFGNLNVSDSGSGQRYARDESSFADTRPIIPGIATVEIRFSYERPFQDELRLTRDLDIPIQSVLLLLQGEELVAEGPDVTFNGVIETQMGNSASYLVGPLAADEDLIVTIAAQPDSVATQETKSPSLSSVSAPKISEIVVGVGALAVAGLATFALWAPARVPEMPDNVRPLLTAIARLDRDYADGNVDESIYRSRRAALKRKLAAHMSQRED